MATPRFLEEARAGAFRGLFPVRRHENLLFGGFTFAERWALLLAGKTIASGLTLVANPLAVPGRALIDEIARTRGERAFVAGGRLVAALVKEGTPLEGKLLGEAAAGLSVAEAEATVVPQPWDLVAENGNRIAADVALWMRAPDDARDLPPGAVPIEATESPVGTALIGREGFHIGPGCRVEPYVFVDTREGPVVLGARVVVEAHAILRGPLWVRNDAIVRGGARIGHGTTIGEGSRVAGEVEGTIFGAFSNKQHEGFLGHAVAGEWVNLGAGTNNSDLKNNYGTIRLGWGEGTVDTGLTKLGCFLGDHVKSAIGTRIGTGAVVGPASNLFGPVGLVTGYVPPFTWGEGGDIYDFDRAADTMNVVRLRRRAELERAGRPLAMPERQLKVLRQLWERRARHGG